MGAPRRRSMVAANQETNQTYFGVLFDIPVNVKIFVVMMVDLKSPLSTQSHGPFAPSKDLDQDNNMW